MPSFTDRIKEIIGTREEVKKREAIAAESIAKEVSSLTESNHNQVRQAFSNIGVKSILDEINRNVFKGNGRIYYYDKIFTSEWVTGTDLIPEFHSSTLIVVRNTLLLTWKLKRRESIIIGPPTEIRGLDIEVTKSPGSNIELPPDVSLSTFRAHTASHMIDYHMKNGGFGSSGNGINAHTAQYIPEELKELKEQIKDKLVEMIPEMLSYQEYHFTKYP